VLPINEMRICALRSIDEFAFAFSLFRHE